jgi:apolipoprotein N-acyltransferase
MSTTRGPSCELVERLLTTTWSGRLALSCLSAACAWLTAYPYELWPLALLSWVPFVVAISKAGTREAIILGAVHGTVLNALAFHWLVEPLERVAGASAWQAFSLVGVFALVQGGRGVLLSLLYKAGRRVALGVSVAFAPSLVTAELVYPMVLPWQTAVFVQPVPVWLQTAELGGALAVSFWIALVNGMLASAYLGRLGRPVAPAWRWLSAAAALVALVSAYGLVRIHMVEASLLSAERARVGVVQGYFGSPTLPWEAVGHYRNETMQLLRRDGLVDLVVWPETAIRAPVPEAALPETLRAQVIGDRKSGTQFIDVPTLLGLVLEDSGATANGHHGPDDRPLTNSAVLSDENGEILGRYDKRDLVPIGERQALDWLPLSALIPTVARFRPGDERPSPRLEGHPLAISICYEDVLRSSFRDSVSRADPHLLINLTSDRWFKDSPGPALHLALASFRAVEHRRYLVRATTTGRSAVVDPTGRVVWQLPEETIVSGVAEVRWLKGRSIYDALGDWPWVALAGLYGMAVGWRSWSACKTAPP